ncbi:hypothetical protein [Rhodococcus qingshengii]|uniref:hypothetical protein n=1 Tax=Rhodococcus qingshengii TaxID=334542 RepID=UPI0018DA438C|nr:hypothetical protein [Rhodococcus qingshengii]QPG90956.1 hypothetical protein I1G86_06760 [Rhodococcus qingshengii]
MDEIHHHASAVAQTMRGTPTFASETYASDKFGEHALCAAEHLMRQPDAPELQHRYFALVDGDDYTMADAFVVAEAENRGMTNDAAQCEPWCTNTAGLGDGARHLCIGQGSGLVNLTAEPGELSDDGITTAAMQIGPERRGIGSDPVVYINWQLTSGEVVTHMTPAEARILADALIASANTIESGMQKN